MGSTGSGNFTDYNGFTGSNPKQGGKSQEEKCGKAFSADLEDVELSNYYLENNNLPETNSEVIIHFNGMRIVASIDGLEIGNLPTKFNYLLACFEKFNYSGIISYTTITPLHTIKINVTPNE